MSENPPLWMDIATLSRNICHCERTIEGLVKEGLLPPPRLLKGKRLWKWKTVEDYLEGRAPEAPSSPEEQARSITNATRQAAVSTDRNRHIR